MTDAQLGILITAIAASGGTIAGTLRWTVGRITKALDDNTVAREKGADAQIELAKAMTTLSVKVDAVADWVIDHTPTPVPVDLAPEIQPARSRTPVQGVRIVERARTRGGDDR